MTQPPDYKALGAQQAQADFAAASAGGGWKFEPEAMTKVISELDATIDGDLRHATVLAANLVQIRQPGSDVGSVGYVNVAKTSGASYQQFLQSAVDFVKAYRDKLKEVSDAYQRHDEAALEALRGTGKVD
ncbi:PE domain-containing protein [Amycolatopsis sp. NPDC051903]|uniref:PE domain-containing protein n=1 Tax=Amycolatopsis sp. NPDC051903 TaxID=3363936 RepID=UPI00378B3497